MSKYSVFSFDKKTFSKIEKIHKSNLTFDEALKYVNENKGTSYINEEYLTSDGDFKMNFYGFTENI